jgi:spore coat protein CotH
MHGSSVQRRTRWRRSWLTIAAASVVLVLLLGVIGRWRIHPYLSTRSAQARPNEATVGGDARGTVDVFDTSIVHEISITMPDENRTRMLADFQDESLKTMYRADITIDGALVRNVGIRLKGNASLFGLRGGFPGGGFPGGGFPGGGFPGGGFPGGDPPRGVPGGAGNADDAQPENGLGGLLPGLPGVDDAVPAFPGGFPGGGFPGGGFPGQTQLSADRPEGLPYLVQFDEFVPGQRFQGRRQMAIRTNGGFGDSALLAEQVAFRLVGDIGEPNLRTSYAGLRFNGSDEALHTVTEVFDDESVAREFDGRDGTVYKAKVGANLSSRGSDPLDYQDFYEADSGVGAKDLDPLIDFINFVDRSNDADFAGSIETWLDVESFARTLALRNIISDLDSIGASGNNYYLWWDGRKRQMRILVWDSNLAFGKFLLFGDQVRYDPYYNKRGESTAAPGRFGGFGGFQSSRLVDRLMALDSFVEIYDREYRSVFDTAVTSGRAERYIRETQQTLRDALRGRPSLIDIETLDAAVNETMNLLDNRGEYLRTIAPLSTTISTKPKQN